MLCKVLMLVAWLTLPIINAQCLKDVMCSFADLNLCSITDELVHCTSLADVILQHVDKLLVCLHAIGICNQGVTSDKDLS